MYINAIHATRSVENLRHYPIKTGIRRTLLLGKIAALGKTCYLCVEKINHDKTCYPQGFDKLLQEQVDYMAGVVITDEEISSVSRTIRGSLRTDEREHPKLSK